MAHYSRYPHIARDLITFTAQDDVWLASLSEAAGRGGTQARRLTADQVPVRHPRLNPSATHVAWTSTRGTRALGRGAPPRGICGDCGRWPGQAADLLG
jgi:tricorn protease